MSHWVAVRKLGAALLLALPMKTSFALDLDGTVWDRPAIGQCRPAPELLYAMALVESKQYAGRMVAPNPYALNIDGKGFHPASRAEAEHLLTEALSRTKMIAVGAMQVSVRWNGHRVSDPSELLDLHTNVRVAVSTFCEFLKQQGGDIALAIGRYHTPNPALASVARAYGEDVLRVWRRLILLKKSNGDA
ncbi:MULTISPECIES: lytic transglycosylase [Pseudomonas]|jgi:hypothetical protein|uniref:lytic transglycosylase n=1 Tax=Pseudomonas TaxID=286 RepID=UPI0005867B81|nr:MULTISPECIES: lytic transglycosylase [Pseudomonas]